MRGRIAVILCCLATALLTLQLRFNFINAASAPPLILLMALFAVIIISAIYAGTNKSAVAGLLLLIAAAFIIRSLPMLIDTVPPNSDGWRLRYVFDAFVSARQMNAIAGPRYWGTSLQISWPSFYILALIVRDITGVSTKNAWMWAPPIFGSIIIPTLYFGGKHILGRRAGMVASAIGVGLVSLIYYSAEFHPQGLANVLFTLFIILFIFAAETRDNRWMTLFCTALTGLLVTHSFTSLLTFPAIMGAIVVWKAVSYLRIQYKPNELLRPISAILFGLIVVGSVVVIHLLLNPNGISSFGRLFEAALTASGPVKGEQTVGKGITKFDILNYISIAIFGIIGGIGGLMAFYRGTQREIGITAASGTLFLGVITAILSPRAPINRLLGLFLTITALLVGVQVARTHRKGITTTVTALVTVAIVLATMAAYPPVFWTDTIGEDSDYRYNNAEMSMAERTSAGAWSNYLPSEERIIVTQDTKSVFFYYGSKQWFRYQTKVEAPIWPPDEEIMTVYTDAGDLSQDPTDVKIYDSGSIHIRVI